MLIWLVNFLWFFFNCGCFILVFVGRMLVGWFIILIFLLIIFVFEEFFLLDIFEGGWFNLLFFLFDRSVLFLEDCFEGVLEVLVIVVFCNFLVKYVFSCFNDLCWIGIWFCNLDLCFDCDLLLLREFELEFVVMVESLCKVFSNFCIFVFRFLWCWLSFFKSFGLFDCLWWVFLDVVCRLFREFNNIFIWFCICLLIIVWFFLLKFFLIDVIFLCFGFVGGVFFLKVCENLVSVFINEFCCGEELILLFNVVVFFGDDVVLWGKFIEVGLLFFDVRILLFEFFFFIWSGFSFLCCLFIFGVRRIFLDFCFVSIFGLISLFSLIGFVKIGLGELVL